MSRFLCFVLSVLSVAIFTSTFATASATCSQSSNAVCLVSNQTACHVNISTTTPSCVAGAPTDSCFAYSTSSTCAVGNCFWDPYLPYCFVSILIDNFIFPCSTWNQSQAACDWHGCGYRYADGACLVYGTNGTDSVAGSALAAITSNNLANFSQPFITQDTTIITGTISIPLNIVLAQPVEYVFAIGTANVGLAKLFGYVSLCNSLTSNLSTTPPAPVIYVPGAAYLTNYLISFVNANQNLNFDNSAAGQALRQYYGNITVGGVSSFLTSVSVSPNNNSLVFTYSQDLNTLTTNCHASYQMQYTVATTYTSYTMPISVVQYSYEGAYSASETSYAIQFATTGAITVSEGVLYQGSIVLTETVPIAGTCALGSHQLQLTYTLSYSNVQSTGAIVGPRYTTDILQQYGSSGLLQCYGDAASTVTPPTTCTSGTCVTTIVMLSRCRIVTVDGNEWNACNGYTSASDRLADLGNATGIYSSSLNSIHNFYVQAYTCPASRSNDALCQPTATTPDYVQSSVTLNDFPQGFVTAPNIQIDFGLLSSITANLSVASDNTTWTTFFNASNVLPATPVVQLAVVTTLQRMTFALQIHDPAIRYSYALMLVLGANFTITPLNYLGVYNGGVNLTWNSIAPYTEIAPKQYIASICPFCTPLATCVGVSGCDGLSIQASHLLTLSPAQAYAITATYQLTIPAPSAHARRRRLLDTTVSDGVAFSQTVFIFNLTAIAGSDIDSSTQTTVVSSSDDATGLSAGVIIGVVIAILLVLSACGCIVYYAITVSSDGNTSNRAPLPALPANSSSHTVARHIRRHQQHQHHNDVEMTPSII